MVLKGPVLNFLIRLSKIARAFVRELSRRASSTSRKTKRKSLSLCEEKKEEERGGGNANYAFAWFV